MPLFLLPTTTTSTAPLALDLKGSLESGSILQDNHQGSDGISQTNNSYP